MIVLKIELWPRGDANKAREIGRAYIANVGGTGDRGDYQVAMCRRGLAAVPSPINPNGPKGTRTGEVKNYPRQAYNVWRLIARAVLAAFPEEIPTSRRAPSNRNSIRPTLGAGVMRGLGELAKLTQALPVMLQDPDVEDAKRWLEEGETL